MKIRGRAGGRQNGGAIIEFALSSIIWIPLMLGLISVGLNLVLTTQLIQLNRNVGHIYAYGVDLSPGSSNQQLATQLANGLDFSSGGSGVFIFSTILLTGPSDCVGISPCPNQGLPVVTQRFTIGNAALYTSTFGNPASVNAATGVVSNYMTDTGAVAGNFLSVIPSMQTDQTAFLVETYYSSSYNVASFLTGNAIYERAIF
jgi:hypothetical protein